MTTAAATRAYLTPPQVAARLGVDPSKVLGWIRSGELRAANIATRRGGRARWVISELDLAAFLAARAAVPRLPQQRQRRRHDPDEIQYF